MSEHAVPVSLLVSRFPKAAPAAKMALGSMNEMTWPSFAALTTKRREGKKDGACFVLASFKPEPDGKVRRINENVVARTAIGLDVETSKKTGEVPPPMKDVARRIEGEGWAAALYTSHSHSPAQPRYRVLLPLSAEMPPHLPVVEVIAEVLGLSGVLDIGKVGAASVLYLPSSVPGELHDHEATIVEGEPVDATWIAKRAGAVLAAREAAQAAIRAEAFAAAEKRCADRIDRGEPPDSNLIEKIRGRLDIHGELLAHGYAQKGDRYLCPDSQSGIPGVHVMSGQDGVERVFSHHSSDPLAAENLPAWCTVKAVDVVDLVVILDYGADRTKGLHQLATRFGIGDPKPKRQQSMQPPEWVAPIGAAAGKHNSVEHVFAEIDRPIIQVVKGEIDRLATVGEDALRTSGLPIFQRASSLVIPISHDVPAARGRMTVAAGFKELCSASLIDHLAQAAIFQHWDARRKKDVPCDPPALLASVILSRGGRWTFPRVAGVITTPTLRPDGSILSEPGYDPQTRLYHVPDRDLIMPPMSTKPSREEAETALAALQGTRIDGKYRGGLLDDFPFVSEVDRAVALSAVITPVVRGALPVVPMHAIAASTAGTGKSYLCDTASVISTARICPVVSAGQSDEETEKRLVGLLLAGFPIVSIDNVNGELGGDLLCQAIERPLVRVRPLGRSDIVELESRATMFATGNGIRVRGDMTRRSLICNLDAGIERPELRTFSTDPVMTVLKDRGKYVAAAMTIVRAYMAAGQPEKAPRLASFTEWSEMVRSALIWLGCSDPAASMETAREDDPELSELRQILGLWTENLGTDGQTAREIAERSCARFPSQMGEPADLVMPDLRDALLAIAGERGTINTRRLGKWLLGRAGRIVDGKRIKRGGTANGGLLRWSVEVC